MFYNIVPQYGGNYDLVVVLVVAVVVVVLHLKFCVLHYRTAIQKQL